jgi:DNA-binding LacI/PurR family transcriptional regulator
MRKTIEYVAQLAKVSKATVSRVLNDSPKVTEETRERVMKVVKELGYYPSAMARRLTTNKAETIGIIIPAPHDRTFGNPFYTEILRGFTHQAKIKKYDLLLFTNEHKFNYSQLFYDRRVDGLLLIGVKRNDKGIIQLSKKNTSKTVANITA